MNSLYSRLADEWDELFPPDAEREAFLTRLISRVSAEAKVVELGCGTGATSRAMAEAGFSVSSSDIDPGMTAFARRGMNPASGEEDASAPFPGPGAVRFRTADMIDALGALDEESAHAVLCLGNTLPYAGTKNRIADFIRGASAALSPGGVLVIQVLNYLKIVSDGGWTAPPRTSGDLTFRRRHVPDGDSGMVSFETEVTVGERSEHRIHRLLSLESEELAGLAASAGLVRIGEYGDWNGGAFTRDSSWLAGIFEKAPRNRGEER